MHLDLQTDTDIYVDNTANHTPSKKLQVADIKYKSVQVISIHGGSIIIWGFIMVKQFRS